MIIIIRLLSIFIIISSTSFAQLVSNQSTSVLVKGTIIDGFSGSPVSIEIEIRGSSGNKMKLRSNSLTGQFEQLLNAGNTYTLLFNNYDIIRQFDTLIVDTAIKFKEQEVTFKVKKLTPGTTVYQADGFSKGLSKINVYGKNILNEVAAALKFNRSVKFIVKVNAWDTYRKPSPAKQPIASAKKSKKQITLPKKEEPIPLEPDPEIVKSAVDARVADVLNEIMVLQINMKKITVLPDYSIGLPLENPNADMEPDIFIVVQSLEKALD
ncbi:MAG: hypothetical protein HW421_1879 [Ignavibacteria bacterium]|nr:hypothetical protein [Ignavibacteria bacterium]